MHLLFPLYTGIIWLLSHASQQRITLDIAANDSGPCRFALIFHAWSYQEASGFGLQYDIINIVKYSHVGRIGSHKKKKKNMTACRKNESCMLKFTLKQPCSQCEVTENIFANYRNKMFVYSIL